VIAPFFIIGFQRSGTTLLRLMFDNHPDLAIPLDTVGLWARYEARLPEYGSPDDDAASRRLIADLLAEERIRLWETPLTVDEVLRHRRRGGFAGIMEAFHLAYAAHHGKRAWGDKDPGNMERIDQLNRWFPECRIVHIIRDGRDACLSQTRQDFGFADLFECALAWREQVEWVRRIGGVLGPSRYAEVRYEDLVAQPEAELRRLCDFLGVNWQPAMLEYHRDVRRSVPDSKRHIWPLLDQPPQKDNAGRWKRELSAGQRIGFEKRAWGMLSAMGYEVFPAPPAGGHLAELRFVAWRAGRKLMHLLRIRS